jgi:hypothetical protein
VISNTATCPIFSGIIFKNEIYDVRGGSEGTSTWQPAAKECGILYGYKYCRVFVHIPTSTDVVTDRYRTALMTNNYEKKPILFTHYKHQIYNNMPEWFIDRMKEFAPDTANIGDVYKELNDLWQNTQSKAAASKINTTTAGSTVRLKINSNPSGTRGGTRGSTNTGNISGAILAAAKLGPVSKITRDSIRNQNAWMKTEYCSREYYKNLTDLFFYGTRQSQE